MLPVSGYPAPRAKVHRAADLFVEERVARVARDAVVRADGALAEEAAAGVHVEHAEEKILALVGAGVDDFAVFEASASRRRIRGRGERRGS